MPESVYFFWGIVALLALAAGCNHGWHHLRDSHLTARLTRASSRGGAAVVLLTERRDSALELDVSHGA
jgi:hypothetical protein